MASPISAQQRSAEESRQQFETRMMNMVSRLQMTDAVFFYKKVHKSMATAVVSKTLAYSMEFPKDFHTDHGGKFGKDATFENADTHQTWPIKITTRTFEDSKVRVFAYGRGGWKAFLMDNHIKVGDILIFKLIKWSYFEVFIGRSPVEVHSDDNNIGNQGNAEEDNVNQNNSDEDNSNVNNSNEDNADQAPVWCTSGNELPSLPKFVVTICRPSEPEYPENHFYLEKDLSLVVPSHFWELHSRMLEGDKLQLEGPTKTVTMVKVERTYDREVQKIRLMHFGWKAFLLANNLAIGDVLEFSLIANSSFIVSVLEQIENH